MSTNNIVKKIVVNIIVWSSTHALAWTVSDSVVQIVTENNIFETQTSHFSNPGKLALKEGQKKPPVFYNPPVLKVSPEEAKQTGPVFEKNQSILEPDEQGLVDHRRALRHLKNGEKQKAKILLQNTLNHLPSHHMSRIELTMLYLKEGNLNAAEILLQDGLHLDENNPELLRLMAILHDKKNEPEQAVALLMKVKESERDRDYFAFLGYLYQETGRYVLARQQYFRLLQLEPQNPLWLLGVSIALDSEGKRAAALEGYQKLKNDPSLDAFVLDYIRNRIEALQR